MQLTFLYDAEEEYWNDGLKKAIQVLDEKWDVKWMNGEYVNYMADFVLVWGGLNSPQVKRASELPYRKAVCVAGTTPMVTPWIHEFDIVFVETKWHLKQLRSRGINAQLAFGTNTDIFYNMKLNRHFDYIYPAAFAKWKRHELFVNEPGSKLAVGYMQPNGHEKECYEICLQNDDTVVMPRVKPAVLSWLYNQARTAYIPSELHGGGERAILEALACGCEVRVEPDNPKLVELLEDTKEVPTYLDYANALRRGIKAVA